VTIESLESKENETTQSNCAGFEPLSSVGKMLWMGREVQLFPCDPFYRSVNAFDFWKMLREVPKKKPHVYNCNVCNSPLVDFFKCYKIEPLDEGCLDYEEDWQREIDRAKIVSAVFGRTCKNCISTNQKEKIFVAYPYYSVENYSIPIGLTDETNDTKAFHEPLPLIKPPSFSDRLITFVDNSGQDLEDINEALIAGFFRSFGIVRESVDFFVAVGNFLKEKVGITKDNENRLSCSGYLEEEARKSLKDVSKPSNLESFRKIFKTGCEIQKAACDHLGIKYEPDTPVKRVLEEIGAVFPFGPLWMAISAIGQTSQELGFIDDSLKPFYEIGLAIVCLKGLKSNPYDLKKLSQTLSRKIDLKRIQKGTLGEIAKLEKEVKFFIEQANKKPRIKPPLKISETIPPTQARYEFGWKVGDPINNRTITGDIPTWSAVRARHWKNKALNHRIGKVKGELKYEPTPENISRMEKGLAPQVYNKKLQKWESIELHHEPPQRQGGLFDFEELTVKDHIEKDLHRARYVNHEGIQKNDH